MNEYHDFISGKFVRVGDSGFEVDESNLNAGLYGWQKQIVAWACRKGRAALFEDCGLGKTRQQLAWAEQVVNHTGGKILIVAPLAVNRQTAMEGAAIGVEVTACRTQDDVRPGVNITNYEMIHHFSPEAFTGVVLDESGILKAFMGKMRRQLTEMFSATPYRLACTATPAPNDHDELGNHSEFLGYFSRTEMLSRWFKNDGFEASKYILKGHAEDDFWRWVASWAVCIQSPSDLGYTDDRFTLPPLHVVPHTVKVDECDFDRGLLVDASLLNIKTLHDELRRTAPQRAEMAASIVNPECNPALVWCFTDYEAKELMARIPDAIEVRGSMPFDMKTDRLTAFSEGKARVLVTKPKIAGWGLNWQHCNIMVTVGPSYSFESRYQSVRRCWRFGQKRSVYDHVVMTRREASIFNAAIAKEDRHNTMAEAIRRVGHDLAVMERRELAPYHPKKEIKLPSFLRRRVA